MERSLTVPSAARWSVVRRSRFYAPRDSRGSVCLDGLAVLALVWAVALLLTVVALAAVTPVRPVAARESSARSAAPRLPTGAPTRAVEACFIESE